MLLALQDIGKAGAITFVGFDYSSSFLEPLRKGELKGFVVQNPVNMGYLSVKTMVAHLRKQAGARRPSTPAWSWSRWTTCRIRRSRP